VVADLNKEYLEKLADDINKTLIYDPETEVKRPRTEEDKVNILECLYEKIGWPMYRLCREKKVEYSHPLDALKIIAVIAMKEKNKKEQSAGETSESEKLMDSNASEALVESNFGLGAVEWKVFGFLMSDPALRPLIFSLLSYVKAKLAPKSMKVAAEIELTCFAYEGVEAIKEALDAGTSVSTEDITITANYVSSPKFYIIAQSLDKDRGVELCNKALEIIKETIERYKGNLVVKKAPELITSEKEKELFSMAGKIEEESSDDDDDHADVGQEWRDEDT
jgi:hypothetical protein